MKRSYGATTFNVFPLKGAAYLAVQYGEMPVTCLPHSSAFSPTCLRRLTTSARRNNKSIFVQQVQFLGISLSWQDAVGLPGPAEEHLAGGHLELEQVLPIPSRV